MKCNCNCNGSETIKTDFESFDEKLYNEKMALLKSAPKMTYRQDLLDKRIGAIPNYSTSEISENETEATILCNPYDFIGHQDIPKIETPLSEEMQKRTLTFDELREKFQRFSNESSSI